MLESTCSLSPRRKWFWPFSVIFGVFSFMSTEQVFHLCNNGGQPARIHVVFCFFGVWIVLFIRALMATGKQNVALLPFLVANHLLPGSAAAGIQTVALLPPTASTLFLSFRTLQHWVELMDPPRWFSFSNQSWKIKNKRCQSLWCQRHFLRSKTENYRPF